MINFDLIKNKTVIQCKTKEEFVLLIRELEKKEFSVFEHCWENYKEKTCVVPNGGEDWGYEDVYYYLDNEYEILQYSEIKVPKIMELLGLKNNKLYKFRDIIFNVNLDYSITTDIENSLLNAYLLDMIESPQEIETCLPKISKKKLIELVGYDFEIEEEEE